MSGGKISKQELNDNLTQEIEGKVDKVAGKGLSTNDFDNSYKVKVDGLKTFTFNSTPATTEKTDIPGMVNEVFTFANSIKNNIGSAIGSSGTTISQISTDLTSMKGRLATNISNKGVSATSSETLTALIDKVANISSGISTADATATAATILSGYTAYVNGVKVTGTMNRPTASQGSTFTMPSGNLILMRPPEGYYDGTVYVYDSDADFVAGNIKSGVTIFGVTGTYSGTAGIDTSDATVTNPDQILTGYSAYSKGAKYTGTMPKHLSTESIQVSGTLSYLDTTKVWCKMDVPSNGYYEQGYELDSVITDTNFVASNIRSGITIFGMTGTYSGSGGTDTSDATLTTGSQMLQGYTAYSKGVKYTGNIVTYSGSIAGNPNVVGSSVEVSLTNGYYSGAYVSISDTDFIASNIKSGVTIFGLTGTYTGTGGTDTSDATLTSGAQMLASYTAYSKGVKYTGSITTTTGNVNLTSSITSVSGGVIQATLSNSYYSSAYVTLADADFVASNIKSGVSIFGLVGSYAASGKGFAQGTVSNLSPVFYVGSHRYLDINVSLSFNPSLVIFLPSTSSMLTNAMNSMAMFIKKSISANISDPVSWVWIDFGLGSSGGQYYDSSSASDIPQPTTSLIRIPFYNSMGLTSFSGTWMAFE